MSSHQPFASMKEAHELAFKSCTPWYATIELGMQCNLTCSHCYNFDRSKPMPSNLKNQVSSERILELITELKQAGTILIAFTGGEALMHPQLFKFIKKTRDENLLVKIKTNGTLVTPEIAARIREEQVYEVDISLYGSNSNEHDWITNTENSFLKTIAGIKNLRNEGVQTSINYIIHRNNFRSINKMIELAKELDSPYAFSSEITAKYDLTNKSQEIALRDEDYAELFCSEFKGLFDISNSEESLQCECARTVVAINSSGDVYPCIGAPVKSGSILDNTFSTVWKNSEELNNIRNLKKESFSECNKCSMITSCSRSSGSAFVNTGNYTGPNPHDCREASMRLNYL